jgi:hypothetical protein
MPIFSVVQRHGITGIFLILSIMFLLSGFVVSVDIAISSLSSLGNPLVSGEKK